MIQVTKHYFVLVTTMEVFMLKRFFSRTISTVETPNSDVTMNQTQHTITCDTPELKELITKWTENEGWKFENFADFLEAVGVKTPIRLSELDKKDNSFKCYTALNTEFLISLRFGDLFDFCSELHVTNSDETKIYVTNGNYPKGDCIPSVTLKNRIIKKNGKELDSYYCQYFCHRTLKLDDTHLLKVEFDEPCKHDQKTEFLVLQNCAEVEDYLLGLDKSLIVSQVYCTMVQLLSFSNEDISNSEKITISYLETVGKDERVLSKIFLLNGDMMEYAVLENGETFHVFKNGYWRYSSDDIEISYHRKNDYNFSIKGTKEKITNVNPNSTMIRVKEQLSKLWKFEK